MTVVYIVVKISIVYVHLSRIYALEITQNHRHLNHYDLDNDL